MIWSLAGEFGLEKGSGVMKPRELINEIMAAVHDRGPEGIANTQLDEIYLGGALFRGDIAGRAVIDRHPIGFMQCHFGPGETMIDVCARMRIDSLLAGAIPGSRGRLLGRLAARDYTD
jgi:hypothetical protein